MECAGAPRHSSDLDPLVLEDVSAASSVSTIPRPVSHRTRRHVAVIFVFISISLLILTACLVPFLAIERPANTTAISELCQEYSQECRLSLVESIPEGLVYPPGSPTHPSTFETWIELLRSAQEYVDIASMYWTLRGVDSGYVHPSDWQGQAVFDEINATIQRGVRVRVIQTYPSGSFDDNETRLLESMGAEVRLLNMERLLGGGVLHTKLWIADRKHFYTGSANSDWRSLTQVKELGQVTWNCSCPVYDVQKVFDVYWMMAVNDSSIPSHYERYLHTLYNQTHPMNLTLSGVAASIYLSSSPPEFCPHGRTDDLTSILRTIDAAQSSISIAVMDYFPTNLYRYPRRYWAAIDDGLRQAAFGRGVRVRLMASQWANTRSDMHQYLLSLAALNGIEANYQYNVSIEVRLFVVNATAEQAEIPFARVNHNKYMVTDNAAYIGTSNWSEDYFTDTCGIGYVVNQTDAIGQGVPVSATIQGQLQAVFDRDWNSPYATQVISG